MAAFERDGSDINNRPSPWSPEGVNITSQPRPSEAKEGDGAPGVGGGGGPLKPIPVSTVLHEGSGHEASRPLHCRQCGQDLASLLFHLPSVLGNRDHQATLELQFCDVMVLTQDPQISDVSSMVQGLRDASVPVRVVGEGEADVLPSLADVNEVVVTGKGSVDSGTARRVMVILQGEAWQPQPSLRDFRHVLQQADHVILVVQRAAKTDDINLDVEDGFFLQAHHRPAAEQQQQLIAKENRNGHLQENGRAVEEEEEDPILREEVRMVNAPIRSPYPPPHYAEEAGGSSKGPSHYHRGSGYNPNDCCDNVCLACCQDVGEGGCILCCPCCGELGTWCEACCRGLGEGLNRCLTAVLCCDLCDSAGSHGNNGCCGDCGDCGGCGDCDCDCGSCDCGSCDCGSCDCVIM